MREGINSLWVVEWRSPTKDWVPYGTTHFAQKNKAQQQLAKIKKLYSKIQNIEFRLIRYYRGVF